METSDLSHFEQMAIAKRSPRIALNRVISEALRLLSIHYLSPELESSALVHIVRVILSLWHLYQCLLASL